MTDRAREMEFWTVPPLWRGEPCFVLASGPSLTADVAERVTGARTIVVNSSCRLAPWADILFFTDSGWFEPRRDLVRDWPGMVVSMSRTAKRELPDKVKRIHGEIRPGFPPLAADRIRQGRSSGHTAVALAVALGCSRIVLLGFDMRFHQVDGRAIEHHHAEYLGPRDLDIYAREFVPAFAGWNADALAAGVQILNATPGSAVTEFPFVALDDLAPPFHPLTPAEAGGQGRGLSAGSPLGAQGRAARGRAEMVA